MRRIAMVVVCLSALACGQGTYTGGATWAGGVIWGNGYVYGSPGGDLPLPDFTGQGGVPLSLPQLWVDPMEPFAESVDQTIYVGTSANGCPTNTPTGACTYYTGDPSGKNPLQEASDNWCALSGGSYDQRWDVVVTHGSTYNFGNNAWVWCTKYNGTAPAKYLVFHSDCTANSPCTGTNDLGYNPAGRPVCSHGIEDLLNPPLPSMGQRNHGCQGYLGFVGVDYQLPIPAVSPSSPGPYTYDSGYNDLANMFTVTSSMSNNGSQGTIIAMDAASTLGGPAQCNSSGGSGSSPCPVEGVNHIYAGDIHLVTTTPNNLVQQYAPVSFRAAEWDANGNLQTSPWVNAAANHVGLTRFYLDGGTDDDGFGVIRYVNGMRVGCAYCSLTHGYVEGIKNDAAEDHAVNTDDAPGPVMLSDLWIEGASIAYWGGGGGSPGIRGGNPSDIEVRRVRLTYNPRWFPQPAGNQSIVKKVSGGTCTGGNTLSLNIPNTGNAVITNTVVYLAGIKDSGNNYVLPQASEAWYTASTVDSAHVLVTVPSCTGTPAKGSVYGYANNYLVY